MNSLTCNKILAVLLLFATHLCSAQKPPQPETGIRDVSIRDSTSRSFGMPVEVNTPAVPRPRFNGIADQDTVAMLIVLVRYRDDNWGDCNAWWCHIDTWPHLDLFGTGAPIPRPQLPDWAPTLLESNPAHINDRELSLQDSSLSAYFFWQSMAVPSGPHILYGDVWPEVYITKGANRDYYSRRDSMGTTVRRPSGMGYLAKEMLDDLVKQGLDPGLYDHNRDGVVDHIMMVIRRDSLFMGQGWATLGGYYAAAGLPDANGDRRPDTLRFWSENRRDSVRVDWSYSGSQNFSNWAQHDLFAHEYAHRQMDMRGHLQMIQYEERVPGRKVECAYARMCGVPTEYDPASLTLSAHERRKIGWLNAIVNRPSDGDQEAISLHDLYASGEAVLVPLGEGAAADTMMIANRQRISFFDRQRCKPSLHPEYDCVFVGLGTHGLQISLSNGDPAGPAGAYRYGFLPADGTYTRLSRCTGAHESCFGPHTYDGDLFGPEWVDQLTPWTRPNSSGFRRADLVGPDLGPDWFAIDRIRYQSNDPDSTMLFDFVADIRRKPRFVAEGEPWPVIRADSWMGPESDGLVFRDEVLVESGATLHIGADDVLSDSLARRHTSLGVVRITFEKGILLEVGARLIVGPETEISVERGILGGQGAEFVVEPGASITFGRGVRFEGSALLGEPASSLRERFQTR